VYSSTGNEIITSNAELVQYSMQLCLILIVIMQLCYRFHIIRYRTWNVPLIVALSESAITAAHFTPLLLHIET
jgi:hypothetical protein